jgi:hypothetical protein
LLGVVAVEMVLSPRVTVVVEVLEVCAQRQQQLVAEEA